MKHASAVITYLLQELAEQDQLLADQAAEIEALQTRLKSPVYLCLKCESDSASKFASQSQPHQWN